jgi:hypothetical protein
MSVVHGLQSCAALTPPSEVNALATLGIFTLDLAEAIQHILAHRGEEEKPAGEALALLPSRLIVEVVVDLLSLFERTDDIARPGRCTIDSASEK